MKKLALCVPGRDDMELDLTGDITKLKKQVRICFVIFLGCGKDFANFHLCFVCFKVFTIKEGVQYKIRIDFIVQREIVHGLKYVQKTYRMGVPGKFVLCYCLMRYTRIG